MWGVAILHGLLIAGVVLLFQVGAPPGASRASSMMLLICGGLFAPLVAWMPYERTLAIISWASPLLAWSLSHAAAPPSEFRFMATLGGVVVGTALNAFAFAVVMIFLRSINRVPLPDPTACDQCGYSRMGLTSLRCPECGGPLPPLSGSRPPEA